MRISTVRVPGLFTLAISALVAMSVGSDADQVVSAPRGTSSITSDKQVRVLPVTSSRDSLSFVVSVPGVRLEGVRSGGQELVAVGVRGEDKLIRDGEPALPVIRRVIAIPSCRNVRLTVRVQDSVEGRIAKVLPVSFEEPKGTDRRPRLYESSTYNVDAEYPATIAEVVGQGDLRGQTLATIEIYPAQYNPIKGSLRVLRSIQITLHFEEPVGPVTTDVGPMQDMVNRLVLNRGTSFSLAPPKTRIVNSGPGQVCWATGDDWEEVATSVSNCGADYLMIVGDSLLATPAREDLVETLAEFRADLNGFNVAIVNVTQLDASPDTINTPVQIRNLIKAVYEDASAAHMGDGKLGYVLLLGDAFDPNRNVVVPSSYYFGSHLSFEASSDAYYSLITTSDPAADTFSDVFLGRLPVDADPENWELTNVVNNILNYEPLPSAANWTDKVLMLSGGDYGGFLFQDEGVQGMVNYFNLIDDEYIPSDKYVRKMHNGLLTPPWSNEQVSAAVADTLRNDFWVFGMFDHGNFFELAGVGFGGCFLPIDYDSLALDAMPITFAIGSHLGEFDYTRDKADRDPYDGETCCPSASASCTLEQEVAQIDSCDVMCERLVLQPGGSIASFGYSRTTNPWHAQDDFRHFFRVLFPENAATLGDLLLGTRLLQTDNGMTGHGLTLFGDPALNIRWTDVSHDTVDVVVRQSEIRALTRSHYLTTRDNNAISFRVRNSGKNTAAGYSVQFWMGHPDSTGSVLLATKAGPAVAGFSSALDTVVIDGIDLETGRVDIYVLLDSDSDLNEAAISNNLSYQWFDASPYNSGYPKRLNEATHHSVNLADVHEEPGLEILFSTLKSARCYSGTGEQLWRFSRGTGIENTFKTEPLVAHMFKDGHPYVVYEVQGYCYVLDAETGAVHDSVLVDSTPVVPPLPYTFQYGAQSYGVHDLVGDDTSLERLFFLGNQLKAMNASGSIVWERRVASNPGNLGEAAIGVADIDADGVPDVIAARQDTLAVFKGGNGAVRWRKGYTSTTGARTLALADLDNDGEVEIAVTARETGSADWLRVYDASGTQLWQYSLGSGDADLRRAYACAGDVDADGATEIVAISTSGLVILDGAGQVLASESLVDSIIVGTPLLADIDGSTGLEIVTFTGTRYDDTYFDDVVPRPLYDFYIRIYDEDLNEIAEPIHVSGNSSHRAVMAYPAVGDTDGDGVPEVAFVTPDSMFHVIRIGTDMGARTWSQRQGNSMMTNLLAQPMSGTYNQPVSLFNAVDVLDDVALNAATYIDATAVIHVADEDPTPPGSPTADDKNSLTEIIVREELRAIGSERQQIRFTSWDGITESSDPWFGIFISDSTLTAGGEFVHCTIREALNGITSRQPVSLENCLLEDCSELGLSVAEAGTVLVEGTTIRRSDYGINALLGTTVLLSNSVIEDCSDYGVAVYKDSKLVATETLFDGNGFATYLSKETESWVAGTIRDCQYTNNAHGIWIDDTGDSTVTVEDCTIENGGSTGMYVQAAKLVVDGTTMRGAEFGINAHFGSTLSLSNSVIEDASLFGAMIQDSRFEMTDTSFDGNDTGAYLSSGGGSWIMATVYDCTFTNNGDGVWIEDIGDSTVIVDKCTIDDNTTNGIYVGGTGIAKITRNTIRRNAIGVYSYGGSPAIRSRNTIQNSSGGIKCDNFSTAVVESCTVNNNTNAVAVLNGANPDLGHVTGGSSLGQNIMRPNTSYHVSNLTSNTIMMENNYVPRNPPTQCTPAPTKFYGPVDYSPDLGCTPPDLSALYEEPMVSSDGMDEEIPARFRLGQNYPNPFNPTTTIAYEVPSPGSSVEIALYDVAGRRVTELVNGHKAPGFYSVPWNGRNRNGEPVASGVYFLRMQAGDFVSTKKLVLLK